MDYNTRTASLMMFDGLDNTGTLDPSLWSYNGTEWRQVAGSEGRPVIRNSCMSYDRDADRIVTFGGRDDASTYQSLDTTWTFEGGWSQLSVPTPPTALRNAAIAYDPVRRRTVLFGGKDDSTGPRADVFELTDSTWERIDASGPGARDATSLVYNGDLQRLVLFGRSPDTAEDLWEFSGTAWFQRAIDVAILPKYRASVAYDAARHTLVTFGGRDPSFVATGTTQLIQLRSNVSVEACTQNVDYDKDGAAGCADSDCWSVCTPLCPPGSGTCAGASPRCGDGTCTGNEDCGICPSDCGVCTGGQCGDFYCNSTTTESAASCPHDCGP